MSLKQKAKGFRAFLTIFIAAYLLVAAVLYWVVADDWTRTVVKTDTVTQGQLLPTDAVVTQTFTGEMDQIDSIQLIPRFSSEAPHGSILVSLYENETLVLEQAVDTAAMISDAECHIELDAPVMQAKGKALTLRIDPQGTGMALWAGSTMSAGKFDVSVATQGLTVNGEAVQSNLVFTTHGYDLLQARGLFWPIALAGLALCAGIIGVTHRQMQAGKRTPFTVLAMVCEKYKFLVKQLVSRDFNVKYKSSMLGVLWSFLNPLLTMMVYLVVFSTIFKSNIEHFPVYLMSGIVLFNYFSESTSLGLNAITGNSSLITKVYMPKVIYPLSKILSSAVNLCISFIPLLIVMIITGVPFHKSLLLLPLVVGFLLMFCMGMSLILSTMNVFFRDTQFLWSVALTMLNFLTPVFYPESIIPAQLQTLYHMNPLYQILFFMRSIIIGGVSPTPITYLYCLLVSAVPLALGLWIFRKNQDKFVLYL